MGKPSALIWAEPESRYDFGVDHPLKPERVLLTVGLIRASGLLDRPDVEVLTPDPATDEDITLVHHPGYVELVKRLSAGERPGRKAWEAGLGSGDNPIFPGMHEATAWVVGATVTAARAVLSESSLHAFNPAGGLHHAHPARASGFCVYNDPAIAIALVRRERPDWRVLYVDVDAHHGDGVQEIFWNDPDVLTVSLHESGEYLFPGTGFVDETGGEGAEGSAVNLPLPPRTSDPEYLEALSTLLPPLASSFGPDLLVTQLGCDSHWRDPLTHLALTMRAYPEIYALLHGLAHTHCGGRWVATGGGGYDWARVVPRAWTMAFAEMCAHEPGTGLDLLPDQLPPGWPGMELPTGRPGAFLEDEQPPPGPPSTVLATLRELQSRGQL